MKRILLLFADAVGIAAGLYLAASVRFDGAVPPSEFALLVHAAFPVVAGKIVALVLFQCDRWSFRFAGLNEMRRLLAAVSLGSFLGIAGVYLLGSAEMSRAVLLMEPVFSLFILIGIRFGLRVIPEPRARTIVGAPSQRAVLLIGAGEAGVMTLREIRRHPDSGMTVVGFIDDDRDKHGHWIDGVRVLGGRDAISQATQALDIAEILIAIPSASGEQIRGLIAACRGVKARFRIVPGLMSIIRGDVDYERIRTIQPEDLLGREMTEIDHDALAGFVKDRTVLVTGAGGSIGSELVRQLARAGARLALLDHSEFAMYEITQELNAFYGKYESDRKREVMEKSAPFTAHIADVRDKFRLVTIVEETRPSIVFHAAAYKHVPLMEENLTEAISVNVFGTRNLIEVCEATGGVDRFILISTDKAVEPTSVMGASKRAAELLLLSRKRKLAVAAVRFGNVFGSSGSAALLFMKQIQAGGPITITDPEVVRYFMTISEAVALVIQAAILEGKNELYVLEMGQRIKILDLARNMITLAGLRPEKDIAIAYTGLRKGEKLIEEVLTANQSAEPTSAPKVYRLDGDKTAVADFDDLLDELESAAARADERAGRSQLKRIVPEYKEFND